MVMVDIAGMDGPYSNVLSFVVLGCILKALGFIFEALGLIVEAFCFMFDVFLVP